MGPACGAVWVFAGTHLSTTSPITLSTTKCGQENRCGRRTPQQLAVALLDQVRRSDQKDPGHQGDAEPAVPFMACAYSGQVGSLACMHQPLTEPLTTLQTFLYFYSMIPKEYHHHHFHRVWIRRHTRTSQKQHTPSVDTILLAVAAGQLARRFYEITPLVCCLLPSALSPLVVPGA